MLTAFNGMGEEGHPADRHAADIQEEYRKIDRDWLLLHYKISIGLVMLALAAECAMSLIFVNSELLRTTLDRYVLKYIMVPGTLNFLCIAVDTAVMRSKTLSQNYKIYTISLMLVAVCFILFSVHSTFTSTYYIFTMAILLTTIYSSYRVTSITAFMCVAAIIFSELFVKWDRDKVSIFDSTLRLGDFIISLIILLAISVASMVVIRYVKKKNEASIQMEMERFELRQRLKVDELTGIFNRKALHEALKDIEDDKSNRYILAIADLDKFKAINDNWGHQMGDLCLKSFAGLLRENSKSYIPYRYGGDEFCLLFCNAELEEAIAVCEKLSRELLKLCPEEKICVKMTASFGLAFYNGRIDPVRLFTHADQALYQAKESRNAIRVYQN
ncbi:MAG: GGDEF domain-containing protein [Lacrimispora sp.]|uniref:GGDEF domain-containing protein n=1 Tax=Lacrimispora sp. TaxID=2719234 RepID=UPI0039E35978